MADRETVTVRNEFGEERQIPKSAAPFFVTRGFVVLDSAGRVNPKATTAADTTKKEN